MGVRNLSTASISTGSKRINFWDQSTQLKYGDFYHIATITGTGNTMTASSIPSTYKNLRIYYVGRTNASGTPVDNTQIRLNGGGSNDYKGAYWGTGDAVTTSVFPLRTTAATATGGYFASGWIDILNYSSTNSVLKQIHGYYTCVSPGGANQEIFTGYHTWTVANTAINSITWGYGAGNFTSGSELYVYGYN